jgi:hypothetical protein
MGLLRHLALFDYTHTGRFRWALEGKGLPVPERRTCSRSLAAYHRAMQRTLFLTLVACAVCSATACQTSAEPPEVAFRHCMRDQVVKLHRRSSYEEARHFANNCDDLANKAVAAAVSPAASVTFRERKASLIAAYVCAYSEDRSHCPAIE